MWLLSKIWHKRKQKPTKTSKKKPTNAKTGVRPTPVFGPPNQTSNTNKAPAISDSVLEQDPEERVLDQAPTLPPLIKVSDVDEGIDIPAVDHLAVTTADDLVPSKASRKSWESDETHRIESDEVTIKQFDNHDKSEDIKDGKECAHELPRCPAIDISPPRSAGSDELSGNTVNNDSLLLSEPLSGYSCDESSDEGEDDISVTASLLDEYTTADRDRRPSMCSAYEPRRQGPWIRPKHSSPEMSYWRSSHLCRTSLDALRHPSNDPISHRPSPLAIPLNASPVAIDNQFWSAPIDAQSLRAYSVCENVNTRGRACSIDEFRSLNNFDMDPTHRSPMPGELLLSSDAITSPEDLAMSARKILDEILVIAASVMENAIQHQEAQDRQNVHRYSHVTPSRQRSLHIPRTTQYFHSLACYRLLRSSLSKIEAQRQEMGGANAYRMARALGPFEDMYEEIVKGDIRFDKLVNHLCAGEGGNPPIGRP
ncbi:uncharacterized protein SPPG_06171 [Spizellomyces punctatus DAOM BR117]|uniref:Uncharacterized protein n=1 Tax=Spizellomyces punctatus (strain DAOM BR117) TaxID=645134 RepID=A0A0L0HA76_SPIPD|nr:uncharacterized protein SPPG_06171 [Spizellomyces punctatus DAOM BR117]KNC98470.1 hypothetical protein SPPG_06171 [Spizellomyces punctatus DAOM BR117]|eukprot:XP_016606510.1 hypothetical protein SPPG_06171 [Spizellomyces punctatus DAOM BR117]